MTAATDIRTGQGIGRRPRPLDWIARSWFSILTTIVLIVIAVTPVVGVVVGSFWSQSPFRRGGGLTLDTWAAVLQSSALWDAALSSVLIGAASTLLAVPIGTGLAYLLNRTDVRFARQLESLVQVNILISPFILATAWIGLASPQSGLLNGLFLSMGMDAPLNIYTFAGLVFVISTWLVPLVFSTVRPAIRNADPRMEEAAMVSGASVMTVFRTVTLPSMRPAILGTIVISFVLGTQMFSIPALIGAPAGIRPLAYEVWRNLQISPSAWERSAAIGVILLGMSITLILVQRRIVGNAGRYVSISGGGRLKRIELKPTARLVATAIAMAYVIVATILPLAALLISSVSRYTAGLALDPSILTLSNYTDVITDSQFGASLQNTLILMVSAGVILVALSFAFAIVAFWLERRGIGRLVDIGSRAPIAMPGIVLGTGLLWVYLYVPLPVYGTILIVILAVVTVFLPQIYNLVAGSYVQVSGSLREAAAVAGAGPWRVIRDIDWPILRPVLMAALVFAIALASTEVNAQVMVYSPESVTLAMRLWDILAGAGSSLTTASAIAVIQLAITGAFLLAAALIGIRIRGIANRLN